MGWLDWALWGAFGGCAMEALDFIVAVRRWRRWPWHMGSASLVAEQGQPAPADASPPDGTLPAPGAGAYIVAGVLRIGIGAGIAAAVGASTDTGSPWLFLLAGAAAPLLLEKLTMLVPLLQAAPAAPTVGQPALPVPQPPPAPVPPAEPAAGALPPPPATTPPVVEPPPGTRDSTAGRQEG